MPYERIDTTGTALALPVLNDKCVEFQKSDEPNQNAMKRMFISLITLGVLIAASSLQAIPITGTINMAGNVTLDTSSLQTASTASFPVNPAGDVSGGTGSFASVTPFSTLVNFFGFNIATGSQNVAPLWKFTFGGSTYEFDLSSITSVTRSATDLLIKGLGSVSISGGTYDTTAANWSFDITDSSGGNSGTFQFGFSQSDTSIPDGGLTVAFLGFALVGIEGLRRKLLSK